MATSIIFLRVYSPDCQPKPFSDVFSNPVYILQNNTDMVGGLPNPNGFSVAEVKPQKL